MHNALEDQEGAKMIDLKLVLEIYKHKEIKLESESQYRQIWKVRSHSVIIQIKKGRRLLLCDCDNHTRYCNSPALCFHKEAVIAYPIIHAMQEEIKKKIENIKAVGYGADKKTMDCIMMELNDLETLLWVRQLKYK